MLRTNAQELRQHRVINAVFEADVGHLYRERNSAMRRSTRYDDYHVSSDFTDGPYETPNMASTSDNNDSSLRDAFLASSKARYKRTRHFDFHQFLDSSSDKGSVEAVESTNPGLVTAVPIDADRAGDYAVFEPTKPGSLNKKAMYVSRMELQ